MSGIAWLETYFLIWEEFGWMKGWENFKVALTDILYAFFV